MPAHDPNPLPPRKRHHSPSPPLLLSAPDDDDLDEDVQALQVDDGVGEDEQVLQVDEDEQVLQVCDDVDEDEQVLQVYEDEQVLQVGDGVDDEENEQEEFLIEEVIIEEIVEVYQDESEEDQEDPQTATNNSGEEEEPEVSDGDVDSRRRKRRRIDYSIEVCRDFTKKCCFRSEIDCKFAHPRSHVAIEGDRVTACADSLRGVCFRGRTCKYYHPPPRIRQQLRGASGLAELPGRTACKDFLRGRCSRGRDCRFSHSIVEERAVVCQDFLRGKCERKACKYSHSPHEEDRPFLKKNEDDRLQVCQDFLRGKCERKTCKYSHLSPREAGRLQWRYEQKVRDSSTRRRDERKSTPICSDFLRNKCFRDHCKYMHPKSKKESSAGVVRHRETCRDFLRGICLRKDCRFYHPSRSR